MIGPAGMVLVSVDELRAIVAEAVAANAHAFLDPSFEPRAMPLPDADAAARLGSATPAEPVAEGYRTRLQQERLLHGWTQQQVVDRLKRLAFEAGCGRTLDGLDVNALSRLENGRILRPRAPLPKLFAALYRLPVAMLFPTRAIGRGI
jgi:hypothetical protein